MEFNKIEKIQGLNACLKQWLAKSNITDDYYKKIDELSKLVFILNNRLYCSNHKTIEDRFVSECLDINEYRKNQVDYITSLDEIDIEVFRRKIIAWLDSMIVFISKYMTKDELQTFLDMKVAILHCPAEEIAGTIIDILYDYVVLDDDTINMLQDRQTSLSNEQINDANNVNIDTEMNNVLESLMGPNKSECIDYQNDNIGKLAFNHKLLEQMNYNIVSKANEIAMTHWNNFSPDENYYTHR